MGGGIIQLALFGANDVYLTKDPQITFFKSVYRKYTNFSTQEIETSFMNKINFGQSGQLKIEKIGDLITNMYLLITLDKVILDNNKFAKFTKFAWIRKLGHAIIKSISIIIGGIKIDKQYGIWLDIWHELSRQKNHDIGYAKMIGDVPELTDFNDNIKPEYLMYIPLQFWFNRFIGLALPIIAIQYHDVYINLELENVNNLIIVSDNFDAYNQLNILDVSMLITYVYLDMEERKRFAQSMHEYLIDYVQFTGVDYIKNDISKIKLAFNNPTKELIWVKKHKYGKKYLYYSNDDVWDMSIPTKKLLYDSMILTNNDLKNNWECFKPNKNKIMSANGNITIYNNSSKILWLNTNSLKYKDSDISITGNIIATIKINANDKIYITSIDNTLTIYDISAPLELLEDTRVVKDYVCINDPLNYGKYIDKSENPLIGALIEYNGLNRIEQRDGNFFGLVQPYIHHSATPKDGINLYSFALSPETHQPSGTANLSEIENVILKLIYNNTCDDELYIFALSYTVLRISFGFVGIVEY